MHPNLELTASERRDLRRLVETYVDDYLESVSDAPASWGPIDDAAVAALGIPPGDDGVPLADLLQRVTIALNSGINTASGKFLSYIPSGGIYSAALGRLIGAVVNRYTGGSHGAPGMIALEHGLVRWMCDVFELPATASGVLFSGGSTANLTATVAARSALGEDFSSGVVYTSERAHHSVAKAARLAGIHSQRIRSVEADSDLRLDVSALEAAIEKDLASGLTPMMITATAGTTDTGTIDPLPECAALAAQCGAWFHVDGAYGGFFVLTDRGKRRLNGIELADSITVDAHKSLFMPFGIGGLLVRNESTLMNALEGRGAYMQDVPDHATAIPNYFAMGPELTRPARGLEAWLALHLHGVAAFRDELDRMLDLTEWTATELASVDGIEIMAHPELSIVAFAAESGNDTTEAIANHLNVSREIHVSSTTVGDRFMVRMAFLSQRTTKEIAANAVDLVRQAMAASG